MLLLNKNMYQYVSNQFKLIV